MPRMMENVVTHTISNNVLLNSSHIRGRQSNSIAHPTHINRPNHHIEKRQNQRQADQNNQGGQPKWRITVQGVVLLSIGLKLMVRVKKGLYNKHVTILYVDK